MESLADYFGTYYFMGLVLNVESDDEQLVAGMPGVPAGYEVLLQPLETDLFRAVGGPTDGSPIKFIRNSAGEVTSLFVGTYELVKIDPEALVNLPVVERLLPPKFELTPQKQAEFEQLLQTHLREAQGGWIEYQLPYPKHEFVQFITTQDQVIFHGSNNPEIEEFQPIRKSMELRDETGRGNVQAVYGTHDGLWAMFFAIVDRPRLHGSIRNGVMYFQNRAGEQVAVYNFSINQEQLSERPYTEGALYLLPRDSFVRLQLTPETYANEWASEQPVKPFAKLRLQPEDFPFLEQIGGHDDSELLRLNSMSRQIREAAISAALEGNHFEVNLPKDAEIAATLNEYIEMQQVMMPAAQFSMQHTDKGVKLSISSLPPAVQQMLSEQYQDLLS